MKKIAFLLLVLFATVYTVPCLQSWLDDNPITAVFNIDEEKTSDKAGAEESKEKKDYQLFIRHNQVFSRNISTAIHLAENIPSSPCLEKLSPPPNFS